MGRFDAAAHFISEGHVLAEQLQEPNNTARLATVDALRHLLSGSFERTEEIGDAWLRSADVALVRPAHVAWLGLAAQLAALRGDYERAVLRGREAARAADHVDDIGAGGFVRGELRAALLEIGEQPVPDPTESPLGRARAELRSTGDDQIDAKAAGLVRHAIESGYLLWAPYIGMEAVRRGSASETAPLVVDVCSAQDGPLAAAMQEFAIGERDGDRAALERAADSFVALGALSFGLDALLAELNVRCDRSEDPIATRRRVLTARWVGRQMRPGAPPRGTALLARIAAAMELPSDRQLEVARLVAGGLSSKEAAAKLVVSARTVDNHLAVVYRKLGVATRADLAELSL